MFDPEKIAADWWSTDEFGFLREADVFENQQPIADAHNALVIQMETGWHAERCINGWYVPQTVWDQRTNAVHPTPVQAILAAWEWHKAREGK